MERVGSFLVIYYPTERFIFTIFQLFIAASPFDVKWTGSLPIRMRYLVQSGNKELKSWINEHFEICSEPSLKSRIHRGLTYIFNYQITARS